MSLLSTLSQPLYASEIFEVFIILILLSMNLINAS